MGWGGVGVGGSDWLSDPGNLFLHLYFNIHTEKQTLYNKKTHVQIKTTKKLTKDNC